MSLDLMIKYLLSFAFLYSLSNAKTMKVIYFGGVGATRDQMDVWKEAARTKIAKLKHESPDAYPDNYTFESYPYPAGKNPKKEAAKTAGMKQINKIVNKIDRDTSEDTNYVLVGHSSGSALSNEIANKVKDQKKVSLVVLDGFLPSQKLLNKETTKCISARSSSSAAVSIGYHTMKSCGPRHSEIKTNFCTNLVDKNSVDKMCLHFATVDSSEAIMDMTSSSYSAFAYKKNNKNERKNLDPNLDWLASQKDTNRIPAENRNSNQQQR